MSKLWKWVTGGVAAVIAALLYYLSLKNKQVNVLKTKVQLAETVKETDILESEIKTAKINVKKNKKHIDELDKTLVQLEQKRVDLKTKESGLKTDAEIQTYWNE